MENDKKLLLIMIAVIAVFVLLNIGAFYRNSPTGLAVYSENNTAPVWVSNTTSFGINKGTELVVNLSEYFADADSDTLGFVATQPSNFTVSLAEDILTVDPDDDFVGTRPVTVTASDENNITSQTILVDVLSAEREIRDDDEKYYGKKLADEPEFETHFSSIQKTDTQLTLLFYHDSPVSQQIWVEGDVAYTLNAEQSPALEEVMLVIELVDGIVPKFKLHIGSSSEIFEFGKQIPSVDVADANYSLIDRDDELIDVEVSGQDATAVIKGTDDSVVKARSGVISDKILKTGVFAAENMIMEEAIISLPASGDVNAVLECSDFNVDTFVCEGEWQATDIPFSMTDSEVVFTVDHFSGYAGGFINIINVQSYPTINSNWTVRFNTTGTANLTIAGTGGTQFAVDLQFLELRCGNTTINASYEGNKVFVANFSCNETAYETSRILTKGRHHLNFTFGNSSAVAHNLVVIGANNVTSLLNASFFAETPGDSAGFATLLADVDNDGNSDLWVGAPNRNESNKSFRGKLYLRYGPFPNGSHNLSTSNASWIGAFNFSSVGFSLAKGDFNGDSNSDVLVGAYLDNSSGVARSGSAYLINGGSLSGASKDIGSSANYHARFSGTLNLGNFGWSAVSGDFNNDSVLDVAVGEPAPFAPPALSNGTVYIFFGPFAAGNYTSAAANVSISGTINISMRFGQALAVGDVNGDGADDLIVGAPDGGSSTEGEAYVFLGPLGPVPPALNDTNANITIFAEAGIASQTGFSLYSGLDVNNDTFDDVLVGDPNATNPAGGADAGKVYLIYGNSSFPANITLSYNASWFGTAAKDNLGYSVLLSDENSDTLADVVMGAPGNDQGANNAGSVYFDYAPVPSAVFNVSNVNGSLFGAAAGQLIGTSLASGSFATGGATPEPSSHGDIVFTEGFTPKPAPTPRPPRKTGGGGGAKNIVESDTCISAQITEVYRTEIRGEPGVTVQGTAKPDNNLDAVILQIAAPYSDTVVHSFSVQTVPVDSLGMWEATLPLPDLQGTGIVSVYNDFDICAEKELCKRIPLEETKPFRLEESFYDKDFSMQGSRNLKDNKIHVYYSADEDYRSEQLPEAAEIEYCNGVEVVKTYADIEWVLADGMRAGALTTQGLCGYCSAVYASAAQGAQAPTTMAVAGITGSSAAPVTGSAVAGSIAGAENDFPRLGVMPQTLGGGSGTWLGHAVFEESIEGQCRLSTQRPSGSPGGAGNDITGAGFAGITGMSVDAPADGAGDDGSLPSGGTPTSFPGGRETEDNPNGNEDSSDLGDVLPECSPFNHNPEPVPPGSPTPVPQPDEDGIIVSPPVVEEPGGVTFPGDVPDVDLPGEGEPEPDGLGEYEGPAPGGTPVAYGCQGPEDCPSDTACIEGRCIPREMPGAPQPAPSGGRMPGAGGTEPGAMYSISSSQAINRFFPGVYSENNWVMGQGLVDKCAEPAVQDACSARYESGYEYFTPQELLSFDASSNGVTGSAVAGGSAAGCAGQGDSYNCGTGIGSGTGGGSDSQTHMSMMNNAQGAKEHCGGIIGCFPCPLSITPRRTPEWEQPSNPSRGEDEPGCGWLNYCGVDGDLHTLFYGPGGITSPTGFVVPPMEEFEPGLFAAFKNMITGSAVASAELPQADLLGTVQDLAYDIYENQGEANELCVEKEGVCSPDGRCMGICPEIPGPPEPPVPPEIPGPPVPPQPPQPPGPPGPPPTPPPVPGPDDVVDTDDVNDMPSYCSAVTWREKDGVISGKMLDDDVPVPDGYELIAGPVSFDCEYDDLDLKFNVPDNFKDIRAFRCMDGRCTAVSDVAVFTDELVCDGMPISTYRRQEMLSGDTYLPVEEIEAIEHYEVMVSSGRKSLSTEGYVFEFTGDAPVGAMVGLFSPDFDVPLAANPSIAIISTPLVVEFGQEIPDSINARISMPFEYSENFIEGSIAVYLMQEDGSWLHLDSTLGNTTVSAYLYNIADYVENDRLVFAVMAVKCEACIVSEFERVYAPDSRDAIVLVHGLTSSAETWQFLIDDYVFNRQPWQIWTFNYPSYMTVDEMAKDLADSIQQNNDEFDRIYVVGHSLGGFIGQRALEIADENPSVYSFIRKVRKVILAGNPGKGSPAAEVYDRMFNELINIRSIARAFDLNAEVIDDLVEGREFRRVPGIKYYAIVGTKPYEFNLGFFTITSGEIFDLFGINDGIVTVDSASFVGGEYLDELCKDYFEIKLTHTELIDETIPRRTIERIISAENAAENPDTAYIGYDKYVDLMVDLCSPYESFILVGKRISELETPAPLNCNCGNGVCGEGETAENCPQDCAVVSLAMFCAWVPLLLLLLLLLLVILSFVYIIRRRVQKKEAGSVWRTLLWFLILLILILILLLWFVCAYWSWINWFVLIAVAVVLVIDALVPWEPKKEGKLEEVKSPVKK